MVHITMWFELVVQNLQAFCDFLCDLCPNEVIWWSRGTAIHYEVVRILSPIQF